MRVRLALFMGVTVCILSMIFYACTAHDIVYDGEFDSTEYWFTHTHEVGEGIRSEISSGKAHLEANDKNGEWIACWIQQGTLPHGWLEMYNETRTAGDVEIRRYVETAASVFFVKVEVNRSQLTFYSSECSRINAGVIMWFDVGEGYSEKDARVLDVEIRFLTASQRNGSVSHHEQEFARLGDPPPRENNDYHVFTSAPTMLEDEGVYVIEIDLGYYMSKAFYLLERDLDVSLDSATLKHFSIFIEANFGHGALTIELVECRFSPRIFSVYVLAPSLFYGFITSISIILLIELFDKDLKEEQPPKHP